mgnify:CR=1 FL=1
MTDEILIPLKQFKKETGKSNSQLANYFGGYSVSAIQKMIASEDRKVAVLDTPSSTTLVEARVEDVYETVINESDINWPHDHQVMTLRKLKPKKKEK